MVKGRRVEQRHCVKTVESVEFQLGDIKFHMWLTGWTPSSASVRFNYTAPYTDRMVRSIFQQAIKLATQAMSMNSGTGYKVRAVGTSANQISVFIDT